jgi:hypothetical protein
MIAAIIVAHVRAYTFLRGKSERHNEDEDIGYFLILIVIYCGIIGSIIFSL